MSSPQCFRSAESLTFRKLIVGVYLASESLKKCIGAASGEVCTAVHCMASESTDPGTEASVRLHATSEAASVRHGLRNGVVTRAMFGVAEN